MDFFDLIKSRKSIRSFKSDPIPQDVINQILESGRLAPSTQNRQCWRYILITDQSLINHIAFHSALGSVNFFIKNAPLIIVACADPNKSLNINHQDYYLVDVAISFQQMILTAWSFGIGSCWLGAFNEDKLKKILKIPDHIRIVAMSPFGYPQEKSSVYDKTVSFLASSKKRIALEKIIHYNIWNNEQFIEDETKGESHEA